MGDLGFLRQQMVDTQLRTNAVTDHDVLRAFQRVERERFLPSSKLAVAYSDMEIIISGADGDRVLPDPRAMARMFQYAKPTGDDAVLDVAPASAYSSAVLAELVATVTIFDQSEERLQSYAASILDCEISTVWTEVGDLEKGPEKSEGSYDIVILHGAISADPTPYIALLSEGGRLVCARGEGAEMFLWRYVKNDGEVTARKLESFACAPAQFLQQVEKFEFDL